MNTERNTLPHLGTRAFLAAGLALALAIPAARAAGDADRRTVASIELLGQVTFPTGYSFEGTEVGGLSGVAYDPASGVYYAISDSRSDARFYTLAIDAEDGALEDGDVRFLDVTTLLDANGVPFAPNSLDPEGITVGPQPGTVFVASEGDAVALIPPFVNEFDLGGHQLMALPVAAKYLPTADQSSGIRNNLAFESLTHTPDGRYLYTATENALYQDGPASDLDHETLCRMLKYDLTTGEEIAEPVYIAQPVSQAPVPPDAFITNGLVELAALDNNGTLLALERGFSTGVGNDVRLYEVLSQGALDVLSLGDLFREEAGMPFEMDPPVGKRLLLNVQADLGIVPDNLEALALGPTLPDGRTLLVIASDNNFSTTQVTQFIALAVRFDTIPAALPALETPQAVDDAAATSPLQGDSDDPAIWLHPTDRARSLVLATQKDGGLAVLDLAGQVRDVILPAPFGDIRYNNVDLIYGFKLGDRRVDLAVASDRQNDTLAVFEIDAVGGRLRDVTSPDMVDTIFGIDDGETTAYGLAAWTSPDSGRSYAYVTQASGNLIAQLELADDGDGRVTGTVVRTLALPVPTGDPEDSQAEGMVVDRERGVVYAAVEGEVGLVRFAAEPDGGDDITIIHPIDAPFFQPDIEGLTIYYAAGGSGYLLVSSQGDSTYAVFDRGGENAYLGSVVIGDAGGIDQANESDGADLINRALGPAFPLGLLVVQDGADDPQVVVEDDEELENAATNFKFVPWQGVASAFPEPLAVDPVSYDPRGTIDAQLASISGDVIALVQDDRLGRDDGVSLLARLRRADVLQREGYDVLAARQLGQFDALVARLIDDDRLPVVPGGSLARSAAACRTSLVERAAAP